MNDIHQSTKIRLTHALSAASARNDQWRQLNAFARAWATQGDAAKAGKLRAECTDLLANVSRIEYCWAYPGPRLLEALRTSLETGDAGTFARLVQKISHGLLSGDYRRSESNWDPMAQDIDPTMLDAAPNEDQQQGKQYFEVLIVTPNDPAGWQRAADEMRRLRRADDPFVYSVVHVGSFQDAALAVVVNASLQAVVLFDGFQYESQHDLEDLGAFLARFAPTEDLDLTPGRMSTALARAIKSARPELDLYLLSDRAPELLAGSPDSACIRRLFHHVEEPMEIHLSILDGVRDRYETPYFDNLKKYASRPIGTFHALPIARGKSVFSSNWIRDMGHFYGANILFAESSATTGGLDSLLEPTGNIKKMMAATARAFGAKRAYLGTNGTSTSNKIVVQAVCKPGDIVIVDRNCHKSHHYGFVLSGAQPYYVEAFPLEKYSMYGAVPLRTIKKALLDCAAEGNLHRVKVIDMTNCTFDGHMYNPRRVMQECLAIKPNLIFLWDEAWFGFARFNPLHRRRTGMGAAAYLSTHLRSDAYRAEYAKWKEEQGDLDPKDPSLLDKRLLPDPDKVRIRVYQTHSTHKSMSAFRQGSAMLVWDEDFHHVEGPFEEAFFAHTSTSRAGRWNWKATG